MNRKELYDAWVDRVCDFMGEAGQKLDRCTSAFQSKPVLDKQADVLFLGYNAQEDFGYVGVSKERFYEGNPSFYQEGERYKWKIWGTLYEMFKWAEYLNPVTDGNFIFMNAVYFGSKTMQQLNAIPGGKDAIQKSLDLTGEVIQDIFKPKCVVCFSIQECFDPLNNKYKFTDVQEIKPKIFNTEADAIIRIKKGMWGNIPVYGMPHPSGRLNYDSIGAIAMYLKEEMQKLGI